MSIIKTDIGQNGEVVARLMNLNYTKDKATGKEIITDERSLYNPSPAEKDMLLLILKHFCLGTVNMQKPRIEFNDLSVLLRDQNDQLSFNVYQANNGQAAEAAQDEAWRSRAIRPVVRNKVMSIAAHATARTIFPKVFAYDDQSDEQEDASMVMSDLVHWAADQSNYEQYALMRVLMALWSPASIGLTEYAEVWRKVKTEQNEDGSWKEVYMIDPDMSGFRDQTVSVDQIFIPNFYEPDIQKQPWIIYREVIDFDTAAAEFMSCDNWKYVQPGIQTIYNDANQAWYQVYDTNMRSYDVEKVTYWNKSLDVKIRCVNGVMMDKPDCPNTRQDKRYPLDKFGWSIINNRCFYYKSLVSYLQGDADVLNTLYQLVVDGSYLEVMKPMVATGRQIIRSNINIPGAVTSLQDPQATLRPVNSQPLDLRAGMDVMQKVESSLTESAADNQQPGQVDQTSMTAYQVSKIEQNAQMVLGLFVKMISQHVKDYGKLRISDILQYLTLPEVNAIDPEAPLVYKSFLIQDAHGNNGKSKKIQFDLSLPEEKISYEEYKKLSMNVLNEEKNRKQSLIKVNPTLFRKWKYECVVSADVMNPMSEELEKAYNLEEYDRMIQHPEIYDPEETAKLLLSSYKKTQRDPSKYLSSNKGQPAGLAQLGIKTNQNPQQPPQQQNPTQSLLSPASPIAPASPVR